MIQGDGSRGIILKREPGAWEHPYWGSDEVSLSIRTAISRNKKKCTSLHADLSHLSETMVLQECFVSRT